MCLFKRGLALLGMVAAAFALASLSPPEAYAGSVTYQTQGSFDGGFTFHDEISIPLTKTTGGTFDLKFTGVHTTVSTPVSFLDGRFGAFEVIGTGGEVADLPPNFVLRILQHNPGTGEGDLIGLITGSIITSFFNTVAVEFGTNSHLMISAGGVDTLYDIADTVNISGAAPQQIVGTIVQFAPTPGAAVAGMALLGTFGVLRRRNHV